VRIAEAKAFPPTKGVQRELHTSGEISLTNGSASCTADAAERAVDGVGKLSVVFDSVIE
jgi:hypothetical protein